MTVQKSQWQLVKATHSADCLTQTLVAHLPQPVASAHLLCLVTEGAGSSLASAVFVKVPLMPASDQCQEGPFPVCSWLVHLACHRLHADSGQEALCVIPFLFLGLLHPPESPEIILQSDLPTLSDLS